MSLVSGASRILCRNAFIAQVSVVHETGEPASGGYIIVGYCEFIINCWWGLAFHVDQMGFVTHFLGIQGQSSGISRVWRQRDSEPQDWELRRSEQISPDLFFCFYINRDICYRPVESMSRPMSSNRLLLRNLLPSQSRPRTPSSPRRRLASRPSRSTDGIRTSPARSRLCKSISWIWTIALRWCWTLC